MKRIINIILLLMIGIGFIFELTQTTIGDYDILSSLAGFIFLFGPYLILYIFNKKIKDQKIPNIIMLIIAILLLVFGLFSIFTAYTMTQADSSERNRIEGLGAILAIVTIIQYVLSIFGGFISGLLGLILSNPRQKELSSK